jgi:flavin reductase (DIM6/NTAB) family NADH-FMN oxidoreductase RutF
MDCGSHRLYVGEIAEIHFDTACLKDGKPDITKIRPILYSQFAYFSLGKQVATAFSAGKMYKQK